MDACPRAAVAACRLGLLVLGLGAAAAAAWSPTVTVDPPDRLARATVLGEWATPGDTEGWQATGGRATAVAGSVLRVESGPVATGVERRGLAAGPDLDLGWNDFLQLRVRRPATATGDLRLSFGTSTQAGFADDRRFAVPAAVLVRDGQFHTYRLDLGLEVWWRDTLTDLGLDGLAAAGAAAAVEIDYVEVGDRPEPPLEVNTNLNIFVGDKDAPKESAADLQRTESKHFVFCWSPHTRVIDATFDAAVMGRRALRMAEECYQVYCRKAGYLEPFEHAEPAKRDGRRYKVNITTWYQGTWMGGQDGFMYLNIPGWGLRDEGWGNPVPHEFGHALQGAQPGFLTGAHWESHANYLTELRNDHFRPHLGTYQTRLGRSPLDASCYPQDHFRLIYADFRVHLMLDDYSAEHGLVPSLSTRLWTEGPKEMTVYEKLATLLPAGQSLPDVVCAGLRRFVLLDLAAREHYRTGLWGTPRERATMEQATGSFLEPCHDRPGWWRVPWARAPMRYAYMFHELAPDPPGGTVTVDLRGPDLPGIGEDWRWCLLAADPQDRARYGEVHSPGRASLALQPGETRLFVFVVATPDRFAASPHGLYNEFPLDRHPDFRRYPYELRIEGARPAPRPLAWPQTAPGHPHRNGGGWVADSAHVEEGAFVGPHARVLDSARVLGAARLENWATVQGQAVVEDQAVISGCAWVGDTSAVRGQARVRDAARVFRASVIEGDARVTGYAACDGVKVRDHAVLRGNAQPWGCTVSGTAILDYDYSMDFGLADGVHFSHVPWGGWFNAYFAQTQHQPRGLIASYRFDEPEGELAWDEFGGLHAWVRGQPVRAADETMHSGVLRLNGRDQYLVVDRSVCDTRALSVGLWCRPATAAPDQPLLVLGYAEDRGLRLTARDAAGRPHLVLRAGAERTAELSGPAETPVGAWTHLALVLADGQAALYVNGKAAATGPAPLVAEDWLAPNDYALPQANRVGGDGHGPGFAGDVEDVRFYNLALTADEVAAEVDRAGDRLGVFCRTETEFDGTSTTRQSGVRSGLVRTLAAWVRPRDADDVDGYAAVLDSTDERDAERHGSGVGLDHGAVTVRLDGRGFWETGVGVTLGQWQHLALAFDGQLAVLYLDGREAARTTYQAPAERLAPKNYRIGFSQASEDVASRRSLNGTLRDVRIYDRVLSPAEVQVLATRPAGG